MNGVLAHLVHREYLSPEPTATQALAYILSVSGEATCQFLVSILGWNPDEMFDLGTIAPEKGLPARVFPDVTIEDTAGEMRIFIENKFWASLTSAQPVAYLHALSSSAPSALLFIVPESRMTEVWLALKQRCENERYRISNDVQSGKSNSIAVTVGRSEHTLQIASWEHVLQLLDRAAEDVGLHELKWDVAQLRGLARAQVSTDTKSKDSPDSLVYEIDWYVEFTKELVASIKHLPRVSTKGLAWGHTLSYRVRYLVIDEYCFGIGASKPPRQKEGVSPMIILLGEWSLPEEHRRPKWSIARDSLERGGAHVHGGDLYLSIGLDMEKSRGELRGDTIRQVFEIADTLADTCRDSR